MASEPDRVTSFVNEAFSLDGSDPDVTTGAPLHREWNTVLPKDPAEKTQVGAIPLQVYAMVWTKSGIGLLVVNVALKLYFKYRNCV